MEHLHEIIRILGRKRLRRIEIFNDSGKQNRKSLYYQFYAGIRSGRFADDETAAWELFQTSPDDKRYLMLKSRLRSRLLNQMFFLERASSPYDQANYRCQRNLLSARFLLMNGARESALQVLRATLHEAEKYQFTQTALDCLRLLRTDTAFTGQSAEFQRYARRFEELNAQGHAEDRIEAIYQELSLPFAKSNAYRSDMRDMVRQRYEEAQAIMAQHDSHQVRLHFYRIAVLNHSVHMQHREELRYCDEALDYLRAHPHLAPRMRLGEFALKHMVADMHLGDYESGNRNAEACLNYFTEGSNNWMIFLEYYFLLCMHSGNYDKALAVHQRVITHARFSSLDSVRQEKWKIFGAFLNYIEHGLSGESAGQMQMTRFNLFKFLNEVPNYSRDKRGLNISILILQVLFLLDRRDFEGIINRTEALKVYISRYLRQDEHYRSNCFLKMVMVMEKKDFERTQTERIARKFYRKLESSRFRYEGNLSTLEIIPYEKLWDTILDKLK